MSSHSTENLVKAAKSLFAVLFDGLTNSLFKIALLTIIAVRITQQSPDPSNLIAGLLLLPFFLFSARATLLAKKYGRIKLTRSVKLAELALMLTAGLVFFANNAGLLIILPVLFGTLSAFFGPIRYALQPERLDEKDFIGSNAYTSKSTYVSIITAILIGVLLPVRIAALCLIVLSLASYLATRSVAEAAPEPDLKKFDRNILKGIRSTLRTVRRYPLLYRSILGATWFWSLGLLVILLIYPLITQVFNTDAVSAAFLLSLYALGVGVGVAYCTRLLRGVVHTTYVPISTLGIAACFLALSVLTLGYGTPAERVDFVEFATRFRPAVFCFFFFLLAFCCGMYITPLNNLIQKKATDANRAAVFAANNIINAAGIAVVALIVAVLRHFELSIPAIFLLFALASFVVSVYNCSVLPAALVRSIAQTILETLFRVTVKGLPNFQESGKRVLIVANHTSLLDGLLIAAFMPEKITFVIKPEWENRWFARFFSLMVDLYPLDLNNPLSLRSLIDLIKRNNKVMIFPEQRISVTGALMKVYEGAGIVAEKANANILPVRINGAQYSKFSLLKTKFKTQYFPKITINIMPHKKFDIDPALTGRLRNHEVSLQLYTMMSEMMYASSKINEHLFTGLLNAQKIHGKHHIIAEDISRKPLRYKTLILKSYVLGRTFDRLLPNEERLGILLPNVLANLVVFFALQSRDKVPAMLNFSSGIAQVLSCIKTVGLKTVVTSHKFIEGGKLEKLEAAIRDAGINLVYMEDFAQQVSGEDKFRGITDYLLSRKPKHAADQTAAILFTSGSEGMPKAVLLSHINFQANRYQALSILDLNSNDVFFNALPMFHAFGLGIGTILTTLSGIKTFYYPSPLHYRIVPELVYATNATILCGTDTFFAGYGASAHPYDFFALRYAIVGAEKLKETTAELWSRKFGIRILEGYGATEAAPLIAVNTPMYIKAGTVGRLVPGLEARLEDVPGITEGKRLFVRGDNIMQGYMKADKPCVLQPPADGWHDTGDIVAVDKDGFVAIKGRAKRFAKIGGEMISLTAIEQELAKLYEGAVQGVVAIADPKKGEQLVLITTAENADAAQIRAFVKQAGLNDLGTPSKIIVVKEPPILGTGKFDYVSAQKMAEEKFGTE